MSNLHLSLQPLSATPRGAAVATLKTRRMKRKSNPNLRSQTSSIYKTNNVSPCTECGKQFDTWKALFGHMRCHPERQWRGMNKKPNEKPRQRQQDWADITDEVTNAALILMQMSGWSLQEVFACIESCREKKMRNLCIDLNLPPPMEEN